MDERIRKELEERETAFRAKVQAIKDRHAQEHAAHVAATVARMNATAARLDELTARIKSLRVSA
jgi:hypothetical protein